jgi:hypothetical protein
VLRRQGLPVDREIISTAFVGSTVNLVVSKRFAKRHQMQWSKKGDHRLLQTQTRTPDGTLRDLFTTWYPAIPAYNGQAPLLAAAALKVSYLPWFLMLSRGFAHRTRARFSGLTRPPRR